AEALSVASTALPLSLCLWLVHGDVEPRAAMLLLDELVSEGVLVGSAGQYRFADDALRQALLAELGAERRRRLHLELGEALVRSGGGRAFDSITAGWHLLRGGRERALGVGVATATTERRLAAGETTQISTHELFEMFFRCALSVSGASTVCLDVQGLEAVIAALEPLAHLGEHHAGPWLHRFAS